MSQLQSVWTSGMYEGLKGCLENRSHAAFKKQRGLPVQREILSNQMEESETWIKDMENIARFVTALSQLKQ